MKQLELFPYLLDQKVIDYYHLILRKIKLLKKADLDWINLFNEYGEMRRQAEKDREEYSIPDSIDDIRDFKYRRYIMKLHKDKCIDEIHHNLRKWIIRRKKLEYKVKHLSRVES